MTRRADIVEASLEPDRRHHAVARHRM